MAIALVHSDIATIDNFATTSVTKSFTVGSGTNRLLVVAIAWYNGGSDSTTVTYGGSALTVGKKFIAGANDYNTELWYMIAPTTGTADVVVSWGIAPCAGVVISEWTGVNQASPIGDTDGAAEGAVDATISNTLTTTSGDVSVTSVNYWDNNLIPTKGASDTLIQDCGTPVTFESNLCASSYQTATGSSVTNQWIPGSGAVVGPMVEMVLQQAASGGGGTGLMWLH